MLGCLLKKYLVLFEGSGYNWTDLLGMEDADLKVLVDPPVDPDQDRYSLLQKRFERMEKELKRVGVTKWLLWEEYRREVPGGYSYSRFCDHFQRFLTQSGGTMHLDHKAGDKLFVDFAGKKLSYWDPDTGEAKEVEVFVAILGASQLTFVMAVESQRREDFLRALTEALEYIGAVPRAVVTDNLKSAVTRADKYEPDLNPALAEWARYYGTTILPTRPVKPRDKSLVEGAVRLTYQRIYAPMRKRRFKGLTELNRAIVEQLEAHNNRNFHRRNYSRRDLFAEIEQAVLSPLPPHPYTFKKHIGAKVTKFNHIWLGEDKHYYSVPYQHIGEQVDVWYNASTVEIFLNHKRVAFHKRNRRPHRYTTCPDHLASTHRFHSEWSPEKFINWGRAIGPQTGELIIRVLASKAHPEQAYKSCLGILSMARKPNIGKQRLELACKRALAFGHHDYSMIKRILKNGIEGLDLQPKSEQNYQLPDHENIRGTEYFNSTHKDPKS